MNNQTIDPKKLVMDMLSKMDAESRQKVTNFMDSDEFKQAVASFDSSATRQPVTDAQTFRNRNKRLRKLRK
jgi:hypothetical protein